jgi:phosphohistidine phosphatase
VRQIRHSGRLRAEQTAQILSEYLKPAMGVIAVSGLGPNDDVHPIAQITGTELANTLLAGHLPFLSRLAGLLVTGNPETRVIRFCNAGIVCLREEHGIWSVGWEMTPDRLV